MNRFVGSPTDFELPTSGCKLGHLVGGVDDFSDEPDEFAESKEIALPGPEGKRAAELLRDAQAHGVSVLAEVVAPAVERLLQNGGKGAALFTQQELDTLTEALAGTLSAADLLGRARLRKLVDRTQKFAEDVDLFAEFADPVPVLSPESALDYFRALVPTLGVDPQRYGQDQRRAAFALAVATEETLLSGVQETVANWMETGGGRALVGRTPDGQVIRFERHEKPRPGYVAVLADTAALDAAWSKDADYYIPPGGGGAEIKGRRENFERFLATGQRVQTPLITLDQSGTVSVEDGRHRLAVLRDMGIDQVPVMVPAGEAPRFRRVLGSTRPPEPSDLSGPEQVQELLDGAGVSSASSGYACFLPGTLVEGDVLAASQARYSGPVVEIETDDGCRLRVTVHHPILTPSGWKHAGSIEKGENLVRYGDPVKTLHASLGGFTGDVVLGDVFSCVKRRAVDNQKMPARIEDVFKTILVERTSGLYLQRPVRPLDFHGDAVFIKGKVCCVRADGNLWPFHRDANGDEPGFEFGFVERNIAATVAAGHRCGLSDAFIKAALQSDPGCLSVGQSHFDSLGFGRWSEAIPIGLMRLGLAANLDAGLFHATDKSPGGDVQLYRELVVAFPSLVTTNRVRKVKRMWWTGHVYDLQTRCGFIVSQGIITGNSNVFRTNAADAYNTGAWDEYQSPDVQDEFPEWEYLNPDDNRSRPTHAEKNHKRYPSSQSFNEVRGTDIRDVAQCRCTFRPIHKSEMRLRR